MITCPKCRYENDGTATNRASCRVNLKWALEKIDQLVPAINTEEQLKRLAQQERKKQELLTAEKIIIKGIDVPFWDLVTLIVKITFAAIPAAIIVLIIWGTIISFWGENRVFRF